MSFESGNISINTENIFPIIKKWLYSEKDIFLREIVSNASDAINKMKKLVSMGEASLKDDEEYKINVYVDRQKGLLRVEDNGLGMTAEEIKKYINQIAFSGAKDFLEKYKDKTDEGQIIGHFGLGFYSSFMVSDKVEIETLSYKEGAKAVKWTSKDGTDYEIEDSLKNTRGTMVTMYLSEDSKEFQEEYTVTNVLKKYFSFLPVNIYLINVDGVKTDPSTLTDEQQIELMKEELKKNAEEEEKKDEVKDKEKSGPTPLNDTNPLWLKNPNECTEEEYKDFYKKTFNDYNDPLFWVHLNMDYPFNLKGILYFPRLKHNFETVEGRIKLYYNQVFVADNIKEVIPEFLLLLKGCLDCPDLPLNVSRSFLQSDGYVRKISSHITKKVADKLISIFENDKDSYCKYWEDIHPFVKYGCMRDDKFYERVNDVVIYKTINGEFLTLKEFIAKTKKEGTKDVVPYVSDEQQQSQYIKLFKENNMDAVILPSMLDNQFITFVETKENDLQFRRIDSEVSSSLKEDGEEDLSDKQKDLEKIFKENLNNDKLKVSLQSLKAQDVPAMITLSEEQRRFQEMSRMYSGGVDMSAMFKDEVTLVLNNNNKLIQNILANSDTKKDEVKLMCEHIYDLAIMSHRQLTSDEMTKFIERSNKLLEMI
ncbi:MAG: molecular chaperone HtpG [Clostridiales bacterium]|nr:molecular chaperone HtpG [Clostridiales bacterium]